MLLDYLNDDRLRINSLPDPTVNIFKLVLALRWQRAGMVQTKAQYQFCHKFLDHCLKQKLLGVGAYKT